MPPHHHIPRSQVHTECSSFLKTLKTLGVYIWCQSLEQNVSSVRSEIKPQHLQPGSLSLEPEDEILYFNGFGALKRITIHIVTSN